MKSHRRIRLKEVMELVPLSASTIYKRMGEGTFPRSQNLGGGVVCWRESDILEWLDSLPESNPGSVHENGTENISGVAQGVLEKKAA
jgi:prophage regulatory protein